MHDSAAEEPFSRAGPLQGSRMLSMQGCGQALLGLLVGNWGREADAGQGSCAALTKRTNCSNLQDPKAKLSSVSLLLFCWRLSCPVRRC